MLTGANQPSPLAFLWPGTFLLLFLIFEVLTQCCLLGEGFPSPHSKSGLELPPWFSTKAAALPLHVLYAPLRSYSLLLHLPTTASASSAEEADVEWLYEDLQELLN